MRLFILKPMFPSLHGLTWTESGCWSRSGNTTTKIQTSTPASYMSKIGSNLAMTPKSPQHPHSVIPWSMLIFKTFRPTPHVHPNKGRGLGNFTVDPLTFWSQPQVGKPTVDACSNTSLNGTVEREQNNTTGSRHSLTYSLPVLFRPVFLTSLIPILLILFQNLCCIVSRKSTHIQTSTHPPTPHFWLSFLCRVKVFIKWLSIHQWKTQ